MNTKQIENKIKELQKKVVIENGKPFSKSTIDVLNEISSLETELIKRA